MKIKRLTVFTRDLHGQQNFYGNTLELEQTEETRNSISFRVGASQLCFKENSTATPCHIAFNIPSYTEHEALAWLRERAEILTDQGKEIQDFESWNAKSVYFYDADRNILEFISRRNLGYAAGKAFGSESFHEISEIGLAVEAIAPVYEYLYKAIGLEVYHGDSENFCAIGDEYGLLICIDMALKTWYPAGDRAFPSEFELLLSEAKKDYILTYFNREIKINDLNE